MTAERFGYVVVLIIRRVRVQVLHKTPEKFSDKFAFALVKLCR